MLIWKGMVFPEQEAKDPAARVSPVFIWRTIADRFMSDTTPADRGLMAAVLVDLLLLAA